MERKLREIDSIAASQYVGELDEEAVADYAAVGYVAGPREPQLVLFQFLD